MWRQDDLFGRLNSGNIMRVPEDEGLEGVRKTVKGPGPVHLPACPLMHGTGASARWGCLPRGVGRDTGVDEDSTQRSFWTRSTARR